MKGRTIPWAFASYSYDMVRTSLRALLCGTVSRRFAPESRHNRPIIGNALNDSRVMLSSYCMVIDFIHIIWHFQHTPLRGRKRNGGVSSPPPSGFNTPPCGDENRRKTRSQHTTQFQHTPLRGRKQTIVENITNGLVSAHPLAGTKIQGCPNLSRWAAVSTHPLAGTKIKRHTPLSQGHAFQHTPLRGRKFQHCPIHASE